MGMTQLSSEKPELFKGRHFNVPFLQMFLTMDGMSIFIVKHICRRDTIQRMTGSTALSDMSA